MHGNAIMVRAVFLDRDGVINANLTRNGKPVAPTTFAEFRFLPDIDEATRRLKEAGFLLVIVTNQPDIPNGITPLAAMEAMHTEIRRVLPIDDIAICFHTDADACLCRKPKPGLITQLAAKYGIDVGTSYLIGDRWRDVLAGQAAGCVCTIMIDHGLQQEQPCTPDKIVRSPLEAAHFILERESSSGLRE
jgi:D-glycero-D-manno-heptose 1,7-bisphosphate phosphatase